MQNVGAVYDRTKIYDNGNNLKIDLPEFYPELIKYLFICVENDNDTSARMELYSTLEKTTEELSKIVSEHKMGETCVKIAKVFNQYVAQAQKLTDWIVAYTCPGPKKKDFKGAYPVINKFFKFVNDCNKKLQVREITKINFKSRFEFLAYSLVMNDSYQEVMAQRKNIPNSHDIKTHIYTKLDNKAKMSLMLTCKAYRKEMAQELLGKINREEDVKGYGIQRLESLAHLLGEDCTLVKKLKLDHTVKFFDSSEIKEIESLNKNFESIEVLTIETMAKSAASLILKKQKSIHTLSLKGNKKSFAGSDTPLQECQLKLKNLTLTTKELPVELNRFSCIENLNLTLYDSLDCSFLSNLKSLHTLAIHSFRIKNFDLLIREEGPLEKLIISQGLENLSELPYCSSLKFVHVSHVESSLLKWPSFKGVLFTSVLNYGTSSFEEISKEGTFIDGQLDGEGISIQYMSKNFQEKVELKFMGIFSKGIFQQGKVIYTDLSKNEIIGILEGNFSYKEDNVICTRKFTDASNKVIEKVFRFKKFEDLIEQME